MKDIALSHGILNGLHAGLQSLFVQETVLSQLGYEGPKSLDIPTIKDALDWLKPHIQELYQGRACLFVGKPADEIGGVVMKMHEILRGERAASAPWLVEALNDLVAGKQPQAPKRAVAALIASAYGRQHFIAGLVGYGEAFKLEEVADRWRQQTLGCQSEVGHAHRYLDEVTAGAAADEVFRFRLFNEAVLIPALWRSQVHDMDMMDQRRAGEPSYERLTWPPGEREGWKASGMSVELSGHWRAMGFAPQESMVWMRAGFNDGGYAGAWKVRHYTVEQAVAWHNAGFRPQQAYEFGAAGVYDPEKAKAMRRPE